MKYQWTVCFPNSSTPVATFKTLKAAKAHSDQLVDDQMFQYQFFGNKVYIPFIKRQPLLKGNTQ